MTAPGLRRVRALLHEPLLHFLLLGALLFGIFAAFNPSARGVPANAVITVTAGQVRAMSAAFERTWQRPPTADERNSLVETYVRDEILYREGVALGLDRDDAVIRRRVAQRVEMLAGEALPSSVADDDALQAYLDSHRQRFEIEPRVSFRQAFIDAGRAGAAADARVATLLAQMRGGPRAAAGRPPGDPTPLARVVDRARLSDIAGEFGAAFAADLMTQPLGEWRGPVRSAFGVHVVAVTDRVPARMPALTEVRNAVEGEWLRERRANATNTVYQKLRQGYTVSVQPGPAAGAR